MQSKCTVCGKLLSGLQTKYCSRKCRNNSINLKFKNYEAQKKRGADRKAQLVRSSGGACCLCGYSKNQSALAFHHVDPKQKSFNIDIRQCSNRSFERLEKERAKCMLVCHNCHSELHHPSFTLSPPL